jgi:hypothetical protein
VAPGKQALVCYADIVFREDAVTAVLNDPADICVAIDSAWKSRYAARTKRDMASAEKVIHAGARLSAIGRKVGIEKANAEFIGLLKLSSAALNAVRDLENTHKALAQSGGVADLISHFLDQKRLSVSIHDVAGSWAELNAPQDLARFALGTKAETLDRLKPLLHKMRVEEQINFSAAAWKDDPAAITDKVRSAFSVARVIVRSSSLAEDSWSTANAGVFTSVLDIDPGHGERFSSAVNEVIASYGAYNPDDQIKPRRALFRREF